METAPRRTEKFPNLKLVISMAAGVDHVLSDPHYPKDIPLVQDPDPHMARSMAHWFIMNILQLHRETAYYNSLRLKRFGHQIKPLIRYLCGDNGTWLSWCSLATML